MTKNNKSLLRKISLASPLCFAPVFISAGCKKSDPAEFDEKSKLYYKIINDKVHITGADRGRIDKETKEFKKGIDEEIVIPEKINDKEVIAIDLFAFQDIDTLKKVKLPNTLRTIGESAFSNNKNLTEIEISDDAQLTIIQKSAFFNCESLKIFKVPKSVLEIQSHAFSNCKNLEEIIFDKDSKITTVYDSTFVGCENLKTINLPSTIKEIKSYAFKDCKHEEFKLTIKAESAENIYTIGDYVFEGVHDNFVLTFENVKKENINNGKLTAEKIGLKKEEQIVIK